MNIVSLCPPRLPPWLRPFRCLALLCLLLHGADLPVPAAQDAENATATTSPPGSRPPPASVRLLALQGAYQDNPAPDPFEALNLLTGDFQKPKSFPELCRTLSKIAAAPDIDHVLFDLSSVSLGLNLAQLSELDRHIQQVRAAGKKTFAWIENAGTIHYSVAAGCDTIIMSETGWLDLPSLSLTALHFREAMDLLGVEASVARTGNFKGAVEPFTRADMSPELRAHYREMLASMNDALVRRLASGRRLSSDQIRAAQATRLFTARAAREAGLVDHLAPANSRRESVAKLLGTSLSWVEPPQRQAKQLSFFDLVGKLFGADSGPKATKPSLAVLHLDGQIVDGEKDFPGLIVAGPLTKTIAELEDNPEIRAVAVRINSPGGSASASESLRLALEKLARKKPVAVSMGAMAASGGYWIACLGRPIYAEAETLTGSIGVFALKLSAAGLLHRIGLAVETVQLDESANAMSVARPWTPAEEQKIQTMIDDLYDRFLELVGSSRNLTKEKLADLAGGRVWSGAQAKELGLVDHLGGLDDTIAALAKESGLEGDYPILHYPREKSLLETLDLFGDSADQAHQLLQPAARAALRQTGFDLAVPRLLLRQSLSAQPTVPWLLTPTELLIR